jgi:hypothetical protein
VTSVANVYFSNGSTANIAKIQGNSRYQQMMRTAYVSENEQTSFSAILPESHQPIIGVQSLRDYLPPWLGGKFRPPQPLVPLINALKTAAETYLEASILTAQYAVSFPVSANFRENARAAYATLSLGTPRRELPPAGFCAASAYVEIDEDNNNGDEWHDCDEELVMTVEYSKSALTALILLKDCAMLSHRRVLHDPTIGVDQLSGGTASKRERLEESVRNLLQLPLDDGREGQDLRYISYLILLGESADDPELHYVLRKVLRDHYERLTTAAVKASSVVKDPLFAGAIGAAYNCWIELEDEARNHSEM